MRLARGGVVSVSLCALLVLAVAGCDPLGDTSWLRVREFDNPTTKQAISTLESKITTGVPGVIADADYVNIVLENKSTILGASGSQGAGITVTGAHVAYDSPGLALPAYDFPATLFIPGTAASIGTATSAATLSVALVPRELKTWINDNVDATVQTNGFKATATVTIQAQSEQGRAVEAQGSLNVNFTLGTPFVVPPPPI